MSSSSISTNPCVGVEVASGGAIGTGAAAVVSAIGVGGAGAIGAGGAVNIGAGSAEGGGVEDVCVDAVVECS